MISIEGARLQLSTDCNRVARIGVKRQTVGCSSYKTDYLVIKSRLKIRAVWVASEDFYSWSDSLEELWSNVRILRAL